MRGWGGVLQQIDRDRCEPQVVAYRSSRSAIVGRLASHQVPILELPVAWDAAVETLRTAEFDVLFYVSVDGPCYFLAHVRLAPIQCTSLGIHQTSGIPTIDYYLSSELLEIPEADAHFTERLVRFPSLPLYMQRALAPSSEFDWETYGVSRDRPIYLGPHRPNKLHPDGDALFGALLARDPRGQLVLMGDAAGDNKGRLVMRRLGSSLGSSVERVVMLPALSYDRFLASIAGATVVLDAIHYSACTSAYDVFAMHQPLVTWPREQSLSRYAAACYRQMAWESLVATDADQFVEFAYRIGNDGPFRDDARRQIADRCSVLFANRATVRDYEDFFCSVAADG